MCSVKTETVDQFMASSISVSEYLICYISELFCQSHATFFNNQFIGDLQTIAPTTLLDILMN